MGRPIKRGLDYFYLSVDSYLDHKIKVLRAKLKNPGYAVWILLLSQCYSENGYYFDCSNSELMLLFAEEVAKENLDFVNEVIIEMIKLGLFDSDIYKKYNILTSKKIQEVYLESVLLQRKTNIR